MEEKLATQLEGFSRQNKFRGKGPLCVALVVTNRAREWGLPLDPETLVTAGGGQVLGLGKGAVQSILSKHGITRVLAQEGGRTSRGSIKRMRAYVAFLNRLHEEEKAHLDQIELFWIMRVREFFAGRPFSIKLDSSRGIRHVIRDILAQAMKRQGEAQGTHYAGAVLQHLVGAKLDCALGIGCIDHNSFSTADAQSERVGDFSIGDAAIHVTTAPGEAVIRRCVDNLNEGYKPLLVTVDRGALVADELANRENVGERIDIFEIEQFVALNIHELGGFQTEGRRLKLDELVKRYNEIIEGVETDPSLKIRIR
ncbi:MAG: DUF4928 domain-containing protein [Gammaproteobacteria bacterium]|nr:DUF4928 domain-containing protein [Gammaproteobacteria bacterium]MYF59903.1 DUF4928 domain-containing protein [Gammaproteobacteria bacterium]